MISVTDLKNGTVFKDQAGIYQVISYEHIKMGRGSANIKVRVRNVKTRSITEKSFINGAKVDNLSIEKKDLQFLYRDNQDAFFMDPVSFEQISLPLDKFDGGQYLKDGNSYSISFLVGEPLEINLPPKVELKVAETGPSLRGNSATNIYKDALLENNIKVRVPLFVKTGDRVRVDTRTGSYSEKV
ncbi:elongation factor P [Patescibacteria group bacterium]|nr:elongation factor P [Patescibacteria group bacterium]MCL5010354.1 elongation factor P [Patescibacteria group bacterium]